jgi:hypothetical protein
MDSQSLGMVLAIVTAAIALVIQLQRLLLMTEEYMKELRAQNTATNVAATAALVTAQKLVEVTASAPATPVAPPPHA